MSVLNNLIKLLALIKAQEKKYDGNKLLPYSNCYYWHFIVQQFFQVQLTIRPSQIHCDFSHNIAQLFGKSTFIA